MDDVSEFLRENEKKMYDAAIKSDDMSEIKHWERVARSRQKKKVG